MPWRNVFSGRGVFIISCDLRFKFCVSYALFLYAVPLDRNLASQILKRYLSWHGFWPRAVKVPRLAWQCQITFALGSWLTNEFFNGQPVGELVAGRRLQHGKKTSLRITLRPGWPQASRLAKSPVQGNPRSLVLYFPRASKVTALSRWAARPLSRCCPKASAGMANEGERKCVCVYVFVNL